MVHEGLRGACTKIMPNGQADVTIAGLTPKWGRLEDKLRTCEKDYNYIFLEYKIDLVSVSGPWPLRAYDRPRVSVRALAILNVSNDFLEYRIDLGSVSPPRPLSKPFFLKIDLCQCHGLGVLAEHFKPLFFLQD